MSLNGIDIASYQKSLVPSKMTTADFIIVKATQGTLYFALAGIWGFPYGEQIVGTFTAIDTFLGVCLGISTSQYKKEG